MVNNAQEVQLDALRFDVGKEGQGNFYLFPELCKGCGLCVVKCPTKVLRWSDELGIYGTPVVEPTSEGQSCTACGICQIYCPDCAIRVDR